MPASECTHRTNFLKLCKTFLYGNLRFLLLFDSKSLETISISFFIVNVLENSPFQNKNDHKTIIFIKDEKNSFSVFEIFEKLKKHSIAKLTMRKNSKYRKYVQTLHFMLFWIIFKVIFNNFFFNFSHFSKQKIQR
jgi:hypothetical protein